VNRTSLVSHHLENLDRAALAQHQKMIREYVHGRHGIYALYRRDRLYYVGLATDLRWRLKAHLGDRHADSWDRFSVYLTADDRHIKELECLLLRIIQPKPEGNKQSGKFVASENLRPRFKRDMKAFFNGQVAHLMGTPTGKRVSTKTTSAQSQNTVLRVTGGRVGRILRAKHKTKVVRAMVDKKGMIRYGKESYSTPSGAAKAVVGHACNGWRFWQIESRPGEWVPMGDLRLRL
jgi:hypothetical protein